MNSQLGLKLLLKHQNLEQLLVHLIKLQTKLSSKSCLDRESFWNHIPKIWNYTWNTLILIQRNVMLTHLWLVLLVPILTTIGTHLLPSVPITTAATSNSPTLNPKSKWMSLENSKLILQRCNLPYRNYRQVLLLILDKHIFKTMKASKLLAVSQWMKPNQFWEATAARRCASTISICSRQDSHVVAEVQWHSMLVPAMVDSDIWVLTTHNILLTK